MSEQHHKLPHGSFVVLVKDRSSFVKLSSSTRIATTFLLVEPIDIQFDGMCSSCNLLPADNNLEFGGCSAYCDAILKKGFTQRVGAQCAMCNFPFYGGVVFDGAVGTPNQQSVFKGSKFTIVNQAVGSPMCDTCTNASLKSGHITKATIADVVAAPAVKKGDSVKVPNHKSQQKSEKTKKTNSTWCAYACGYACKFGPSECLRPHKPCPWGDKCASKRCHLVHPEGWDPEYASGVLPAGVRHPAWCPKGDDCKERQCNYTHPRDPNKFDESC